MAIDLRDSTKDVVFGRWRWVTVSNYIVILAQFAVLWFAIQGVLGDQPTTLTLAGAFAAFAISRMASMIPVTPGRARHGRRRADRPAHDVRADQRAGRGLHPGVARVLLDPAGLPRRR